MGADTRSGRASASELACDISGCAGRGASRAAAHSCGCGGRARAPPAAAMSSRTSASNRAASAPRSPSPKNLASPSLSRRRLPASGAAGGARSSAHAPSSAPPSASAWCAPGARSWGGGSLAPGEAGEAVEGAEVGARGRGRVAGVAGGAGAGLAPGRGACRRSAEAIVGWGSREASEEDGTRGRGREGGGEGRGKEKGLVHCTPFDLPRASCTTPFPTLARNKTPI